ncbi:MAG: hypothetical protein AAB615_01060, partial [Patescibacteria group bacterium]
MLDLPENLLGKQPAGKSTNTPSLDQFSVDLSLDDYNGQEVYVGRETETERLTQILSRKEKNNPLL